MEKVKIELSSEEILFLLELLDQASNWSEGEQKVTRRNIEKVLEEKYSIIQLSNNA